MSLEKAFANKPFFYGTILYGKREAVARRYQSIRHELQKKMKLKYLKVCEVSIFLPINLNEVLML